MFGASGTIWQPRGAGAERYGLVGYGRLGNVGQGLEGQVRLGRSRLGVMGQGLVGKQGGNS